MHIHALHLPRRSPERLLQLVGHAAKLDDLGFVALQMTHLGEHKGHKGHTQSHPSANSQGKAGEVRWKEGSLSQWWKAGQKQPIYRCELEVNKSKTYSHWIKNMSYSLKLFLEKLTSVLKIMTEDIKTGI